MSTDHLDIPAVRAECLGPDPHPDLEPFHIRAALATALDELEQTRAALTTAYQRLDRLTEPQPVEVLEDHLCRRVWAAACRWAADQFADAAAAAVLDDRAAKIEDGTLTPWQDPAAETPAAETPAADPQPRVWHAGDPELDGVTRVTSVTDRDGDEWQRDPDGWWWILPREPGTEPLRWPRLARWWGPLTEVHPGDRSHLAAETSAAATPDPGKGDAVPDAHSGDPAPLDLDAIEARASWARPSRLRTAMGCIPDGQIRQGCILSDGHTVREAVRAAAQLAFRDVPALVAEVRRLRAEIAERTEWSINCAETIGRLLPRDRHQEQQVSDGPGWDRDVITAVAQWLDGTRQPAPVAGPTAAAQLRALLHDLGRCVAVEEHLMDHIREVAAAVPSDPELNRLPTPDAIQELVRQRELLRGQRTMAQQMGDAARAELEEVRGILAEVSGDAVADDTARDLAEQIRGRVSYWVGCARDRAAERDRFPAREAELATERSTGRAIARRDGAADALELAADRLPGRLTGAPDPVRSAVAHLRLWPGSARAGELDVPTTEESGQ